MLVDDAKQYKKIMENKNAYELPNELWVKGHWWESKYTRQKEENTLIDLLIIYIINKIKTYTVQKIERKKRL